MNPSFRATIRLIAVLAVVTPAMAPALAQQKPLPVVQLAKVSLPPGFQIALYAEGLSSARQMALAPDGTVFVGSFGLFSGNPKIGNVYAVRDTNRDGRADEVKTIITGLNMPNGVAFRDGALFVGEQHRIVRYDNIVSRLDNPPAPIVVADSAHRPEHHEPQLEVPAVRAGWKAVRARRRPLQRLRSRRPVGHDPSHESRWIGT